MGMLATAEANMLPSSPSMGSERVDARGQACNCPRKPNLGSVCAAVRPAFTAVIRSAKLATAVRGTSNSRPMPFKNRCRRSSLVTVARRRRFTVHRVVRDVAVQASHPPDVSSNSPNVPTVRVRRHFSPPSAPAGLLQSGGGAISTSLSEAQAPFSHQIYDVILMMSPMTAKAAFWRRKRAQTVFGQRAREGAKRADSKEEKATWRREGYRKR